MFSSFFGAAGYVINLVLDLVQLLVIFSVIISWISADPNNPLVNMVTTLTEPLYRPIRKFITSKIPGPIDFAPFILILLIIFLQKFLQIYFMNNAR